MILSEKLTDVFCDNFVAYYRAHSSHLNVTGRNFISDHKLLQKIYEDAQEQIDTIGELIRTLGVEAPGSIVDILARTSIQEDSDDDAEEMLSSVLAIQEVMMGHWKEVFDLATFDTEQDIANYAADRLGAHSKFVWMLRSTLA